ncbi:uncharacterized protein LOC130679873 isoform X1 [Manis pentadactyla]|uniref:uncharacterized protein LOC130679873 isoform X1 n=2 Tax=Manis pentadactyla TaxID=143292 RepID=UPI00255CAE29|nr:uncharacterized protein LOC130679873 isoform X1 [Manis pentadactyla]
MRNQPRGDPFSVSCAPDPRQTQLAPETKGRLASWLQRVQALFQTPVRELRPLSSASAPAEPEDIPAEASALRQGPKLEPQEPSGLVRRATAVMVPGLTEPEPCPDPMSPWDIPGVVSAPVPGPELEPHEPLVPGPVAPAGMAPGLAEPEADPEPTRACVAITRHVWRKEEWTILAFPHGLVAEQLTLICAFPVIQSEITMQRKLAKVYDLEPDERFRCFAQAVEPLDEEESYSLSCQLEPPGQGAGRK